MEIGDWMEIVTYHDKLRMVARDVARKMWVVYSELVRAGFSEDQSLTLLLELMAEWKGGRVNEHSLVSSRYARDVRSSVSNCYRVFDETYHKHD